jgi:hypothetical protein
MSAQNGAVLLTSGVGEGGCEGRVVVQPAADAQVELGRINAVVGALNEVEAVLVGGAESGHPVSCESTCKKERPVGQKQVHADESDFILQIKLREHFGGMQSPLVRRFKEGQCKKIASRKERFDVKEG